MGKTAFMFPGQGAQYVGMGKDFFEKIPASREVYEMASEAAGVDLRRLCFEENDEIHITEYTQIAMLATSLAMLAALEEKGVHSDINAGLSLGEYGALAASSVLSPEDACKAVRQRGILMQEAVPSGGAMTAILGMEASLLEEICDKTEGIVQIANYNCPGQLVISGEKSAVDAAAAACKEAGAKRAVPLKVSGPFHSPMLKEAGEKLGQVLDQITIHDVKKPYVTNVTGQLVTDSSQVKELLMRQVYSSVRWQQCVETMLAQGVDQFIEIGPGKTLSGFMRKIDRSASVMNIEKVEDLEKVAAQFKS